MFSISSGQQPDANATQVVVGEGVGTTADEALKDALRNAVRQVVGALVDAETMVRNDEVIDDKVLIYSDGFIKTYEEVPGSKKVQSGLHRLKIKATVERRNVIAKLKAANITVKEVDGKGLFAEVITKLDAEQSAEAMLRNELEGFPQSLLTVQVVGKPDLLSKNSEKAEVQFQFRIESDAKAYKALADRLTAKLDKIASSRGDFTSILKPEQIRLYDRERDSYFEASVLVPKRPGFLQEVMAGWMPKSFEGPVPSIQRLNGSQVTLAVTMQSTKAQDRLECRYYLLDKSVQPFLAEMAFRECTAKLSLMDGDELVATDRFPLRSVFPGNSHGVGNLIVPAGQHMGGDHFYLLNPDDSSYDPKQHAFLFWLAPGFVGRGTNQLAFSPALTISRKLSLSLDELRAVKEARCEIVSDK